MLDCEMLYKLLLVLEDKAVQVAPASTDLYILPNPPTVNTVFPSRDVTAFNCGGETEVTVTEVHDKNPEDTEEI